MGLGFVPSISKPLDEFISVVVVALKGLAGAAETASDQGSIVTHAEFRDILLGVHNKVGEILKGL
jgi:hypothetical protein